MKENLTELLFSLDCCTAAGEQADEAVKAFCRCNSFKYRLRAARKNGDEDIAKAEWYEEYLFHMEKGDKS